VESVLHPSGTAGDLATFAALVCFAVGLSVLLTFVLRLVFRLARLAVTRKSQNNKRSRARGFVRPYIEMYFSLSRAVRGFGENGRFYVIFLMTLAYLLAGESWVYQKSIAGDPTTAETVITTVPPLVAAVAAILAAWASVMTARKKEKVERGESSDDATGQPKTVFEIESATIVLDSLDNNGRTVNGLDRSRVIRDVRFSGKVTSSNRSEPENGSLVDDISRLTAMREDGAITESQFDALVQERIAVSAAERTATKQEPKTPAVNTSDGSDEHTRP
jgi:hypothetical protein